VVIDDTDDTNTENSLSTLSVTPDIEVRHSSSLPQDPNYSTHKSGCSAKLAGISSTQSTNTETRNTSPDIAKVEAEDEFEGDCEKCQVLQPIRDLKYLCKGCFSDQRPQNSGTPTTPDPSQAQVTGRQNDARLEGAKAQIIVLEEQLLEKEEYLNMERNALKAKEREASLLVTAARQRDSCHSWPREKVITDYLEKVNDLNLRLDKREHWGTFTNLKSTSRERFATKINDLRFQDIYSYARDIPFRHNYDTLPFIPSLEHQTALKTLVCIVLGGEKIDPPDLGQVQTSFKSFSRFSPKAIIRALASSALQAWVFETDFPQFDDNYSEILNHYRASLLEQG
jgi:hypothetical protein